MIGPLRKFLRYESLKNVGQPCESKGQSCRSPGYNPSSGALASGPQEKHTKDANKIVACAIFLVGDNTLGPPDDQIERLRAGDTIACEQFVRERALELYGWLYRLTGRREEAEDLAQESLAAFWESIRRSGHRWRRGFGCFRLRGTFGTNAAGDATPGLNRNTVRWTRSQHQGNRPWKSWNRRRWSVPWRPR